MTRNRRNQPPDPPPQEDLPRELMLEIIEWSLNNIPDEAKPEARRGIIELFAGIFYRAGVPCPDWINLGRDRWGDVQPP